MKKFKNFSLLLFIIWLINKEFISLFACKFDTILNNDYIYFMY